MSLRFEEVAEYTHRPGDDLPIPKRKGLAPLVASRRQFIKGAAMAGMGAALSLVGSLPLPRVASAYSCVGALHTDMDGGCSRFSDNYGCDPACGSSMVYANACDGTWHKYTGGWRNRPNDCSYDMASADGWFWTKCCAGMCGGRVVKFKCHDGCKLIDSVWKRSVCRTYVCQQALC
jgi:hypothetical protein